MAVRTNSFVKPAVAQTTDRGAEAYAYRHNRLHPRVSNFLQPLFGSKLRLSTVRFIIYSKITSAKGTTIWVAGDKVICTQGHFNQEYASWRVKGRDDRKWYLSNKAIDLATEAGMAVLAHELFHCYQWRRTKWYKSVWSWLGGVVKSLWHERKFFSHNYMPLEVEALKFQGGPVTEYLRSRKDHLKDFEGLR